MKDWAKLAPALVLLLAPGAALAADAPPEAAKYVSREEYDKLLQEVQSLRKELDAVKAQAETKASGEQMRQELAEVKRQCAQAASARKGGWLDRFGTTELVLAGDASAGFTKRRGSDSTFGADFSPLLLWQLNDRLFVEAALDFELTGSGDDSSTDVDLGLINISYLLTDWLAVGMGRFAVPFGIYHSHLDPPWINKLPDDPLAFGDGGIAPDSGLGVFATGAFPVGRTVLNYGVYVVNGPMLNVDDPDAAGSLSFENFDDTNNKAVGGRIGFLPCPELEVGYSIQCGRVNPSGFQDVHALLQAVDLNYVKEWAPLAGRVTVRSEWVWSDVGEATYDRAGELGFGPLRFKNDRNGGYVEVAYRPSQARSKILQNLEFVLRYDRLEVPSRAPGGGRHQRWSPGIDYWITPSAVFKAAVECDKQEDEPNHNALVFQLGIGF